MSASTTMSDRDRLIELLRELWHTSDHADDLEILDIVYRNLYQELRPLLLWEFGTQVDRRHASTRFTELLNRFFAKVMEHFPDGMQRVQSRRALSGYVAQALRRMIYEHSRSRGRQAACDDTLLDSLIEDRRRAFHEECPHLRYESVLAVVRGWEQSRDPLRRQWARLINYRYVLLETRQRTARDLEVLEKRYDQLHRQALEQLRREVP